MSTGPPEGPVGARVWAPNLGRRRGAIPTRLCGPSGLDGLQLKGGEVWNGVRCCLEPAMSTGPPEGPVGARVWAPNLDRRRGAIPTRLCGPSGLDGLQWKGGEVWNGVRCCLEFCNFGWVLMSTGPPEGPGAARGGGAALVP